MASCPDLHVRIRVSGTYRITGQISPPPRNLRLRMYAAILFLVLRPRKAHRGC